MALRLRRRTPPKAASESIAVPSADELLSGALKSSRRGLWIALIAVGTLIVLLLVGAYIYDRTASSHLMPGTRIGNLLLGSQTVDEAERLLHQRFVEPLREPIDISAPDFHERITPWNLGLRLEVRDFVRDTLNEQRDMPVVQRVWHRIFGVDGDVSLAPQMDDDVLDAYMARIDPIIDRAPENARMELMGGTLKVIPHELGRDMRAREAETQIVEALSSGKKNIELPVVTTEPALKADAFTKVLVVNTSANSLAFYRDGKVSKTYNVATGTGGYPTPHGQFRITAKRRNPTWVNPNADWSRDMPPRIGPGPNNPLGTRALNLSASGIRIHGTPNDASIGTNASHGCIRMHMHEVEELFEQVNVGTPVLIVG
jgi:hypothetical protein